MFSAAGPILPVMWDRHLRRTDRADDAERIEICRDDDLRLFPIVGRDLCIPVASLLSRDLLEEASQLVSDRCWVASTPLYG